MHPDHDHKTTAAEGYVVSIDLSLTEEGRLGILSTHCNVGLGQFRDDHVIILNAFFSSRKANNDSKNAGNLNTLNGRSQVILHSRMSMRSL